jgi:adenylosuccinate synthase
VGGGPFPTELDPDDAEVLRQAGAEFGATTGRPRRCGWLDIPALRVAIRINGMDGLALTKLDVLRGREEIKLCVAYRLDGREIGELPSDPEDIERAEPVYESFPGFDQDLSEVREVAGLPRQAREYLQAIERLTGVPFFYVGVGAERAQTIEIRDAYSG